MVNIQAPRSRAANGRQAGASAVPADEDLELGRVGQQAAGTDRAWALGRGVSAYILKQKLSTPRPVPDRPGSTAAER